MALQTLAGYMIADAVTGGSDYAKLNNAGAYLGVGDGTTAQSAAQTDLQGTNKTRKGMDSTYPQRTNNVLTFRSTFGTGDANPGWKEWGIFNAASAGQMFSRKVEDLGTKTGASTWQLTVTMTLNV